MELTWWKFIFLSLFIFSVTSSPLSSLSAVDTNIDIDQSPEIRPILLTRQGQNIIKDNTIFFSSEDSRNGEGGLINSKISNITSMEGGSFSLDCFPNNNHNNSHNNYVEVVWVKWFQKKYFRLVTTIPTTTTTGKIEAEQFKVKRRIYENNNRRIITVTNVTLEDAGWYGCLAWTKLKRVVNLGKKLSNKNYNKNITTLRRPVAVLKKYHVRILKRVNSPLRLLIKLNDDRGDQFPKFTLAKNGKAAEGNENGHEDEDEVRVEDTKNISAAPLGLGAIRFVLSFGSMIFNFVIVAACLALFSCLCCCCGGGGRFC